MSPLVELYHKYVLTIVADYTENPTSQMYVQWRDCFFVVSSNDLQEPLLFIHWLLGDAANVELVISKLISKIYLNATRSR